MRVTQHSGRKHRTGKTYSTKHNDRNFDSEADNIDGEKTPDNIVWTWCDKFKKSEDGSPLHSIDEAELLFYQKRYAEQLNATNEKYARARHKERVKSMDEWRKQVKHAPEEIITQIGKMNDHPDLKLFIKCFMKYLKELEEWNNAHGNVMHILNWALHQDEIGAPHTHIRRVWDYYNPETKQFELGQEKALEAAGVPLPHPDKAPGRFNNRKMTFDAEMRTVWQNICKEQGLEIETVPLPKNEVGMSLDQKIRRNEEERNRKIIEAEKLLKEAAEKKKVIEEEKEKFEQLKKDEEEEIERTKNELAKKNEEANKLRKSLDDEKKEFEKHKKEENEKIEETKKDLSGKEKAAQKILDRENSVKKREDAAKQREKEQAGWIEKQKRNHEYLKKHGIDSDYFELNTEIPELLEEETSLIFQEDNKKYALRNLVNFKTIIDEKVDHFKRKFKALVSCVKTLLDENITLRKEKKALEDKFDNKVSTKVDFEVNKLRQELTKKHSEEKAGLKEKADKWDNFLKGGKTTFVFEGKPYTFQSGLKSIHKIFNKIDDYERITPDELDSLKKICVTRGFKTIGEAEKYRQKHNLKSIFDISNEPHSKVYKGPTM